MNAPPRVRNLVLVLGDQLDADSAAFDGFDPRLDVVWMAEVNEESTQVWSHQARITLFLAAMRHFRDSLRQRGWRVEYHALDDSDNGGSFTTELTRATRKLRPQQGIVVEPGEWRVREALQSAAKDLRLPLEIRPDRHFVCSAADFERHAQGRKQLRMEFFYREIRRRTGLLMSGDLPAGGAWNFDADNRASFGKAGPPGHAAPNSFPPDKITRAVLRLVRERFADHPGVLDHFDWPVTKAEAQQALADFITHRLPQFGAYQDAMWMGEPWLFHSRISAALNLKLLHPLEVCRAAEQAYHAKHAPLPAVEGFIRQIIGWREYVRRVYWRFMPDYAQRNALQAELPLPKFYWTGETDMHCLREVIGQTLRFGYAHHIQRLMVTGLYALLLGVRPREVHEWYLAVYVDAVEWVELPNTLGMSQYADGGIMASKPYVATGKYIQRMSNYCAGCRFDPTQATGPSACPFTTLYWEFLLRHEKILAANPRMSLQVRNLKKLSAAEGEAIAAAARRHREIVQSTARAGS